MKKVGLELNVQEIQKSSYDFLSNVQQPIHFLHICHCNLSQISKTVYSKHSLAALGCGQRLLVGYIQNYCLVSRKLCSPKYIIIIFEIPSSRGNNNSSRNTIAWLLTCSSWDVIGWTIALVGRPPTIAKAKQTLPRKTRIVLAQLKS